MMKTPGVALGAGLASALLFVVSAKGTASATIIAYFTALPIMIAAVGFGHTSGLAGALIGCATVSVVLGPFLGAFFALAFAFPAWWLSYLALLARPGSAVAGSGHDGKPVMLWYPVGRIVAWAAAVASGAVLVMGAAALIRFGGYDHAVAALSRLLSGALGSAAPTSELDPTQFAAILVQVFPLAMTVSCLLILLVNLWLAGRISEMSHRLRRPWPNVPDGLRLPRFVAAVFIVGLVPSFVDGLIPAAARTVAAACGMAFALQGLGAAHVLTRGFAARGAVLALIYVVTFGAMPLSPIALCLLGLVDCLFPLRFRKAPTSVIPKSTGD